ncbi:hypothetical protein LTR37_011974 [Vermiconidia calcicola]|uniref:Uncharacterized protein n=1 Tax=Vermiconidia calcicola TaxID=1690605 RepID=A0ACC3N1M9_9PEZI|nr:hypothetical protein LTR37_011974 [Vermiconidia calcicola]
MASPPGSSATSPSGPSSLALPRQRPSLALPQGITKSRKPSIASNTSSAHPLRQTSFPPADSLEAQHAAAEDRSLLRFSPSQASQGSLEDEFSDSEIVSAISGPAGAGGGGEETSTRKRKRGEKRPRGRPAKTGGMRAGSTSLVNGEEGSTPTTTRRGGAHSVITADNAADDEDDEDEEVNAGGGRLPLYEGGQMTAAEHETDNKQKSMFRNYMDVVDALPLTDPERKGMTVRDMGERYDVWNRAKLRTADVRRLVNQTLSQSVPQNVVTVVSSYTKMFAGMLIEEAREVQAEWLAVERERADGEENAVNKRLKRSFQDSIDEDGHKLSNGIKAGSRPGSSHSDSRPNEIAGLKQEASSSSPSQPGTQTQQTNGQKEDGSPEELFPGGAGGLSTSIDECDRGPLLPDHLREALRRYKKARRGGTVGFTGLSLEGREVAAPRMGGKRLFK